MSTYASGFRHTGRKPSLLLDGHVQFVTRGELYWYYYKLR